MGSVEASHGAPVQPGAISEFVANPCRSADGRTIRFPANILRRFVTREGIDGTFRIHYDHSGKLRRIDRVR